MNKEIENRLRKLRVGFVHFVDISKLTNKQNGGLPCTILMGIVINPKFVKDVFNSPDYKPVLEDECVKTENRVGKVTDELAESLASKGYKALSQSDAELLVEGVFNFETKESVLPHETAAQLSGLRWIGKDNLFITPGYGTAQRLGTVLTDAPLETVPYTPISPKCGNCSIRRGIYERKVLKGTIWSTAISRDDIIDVYGYSTCLRRLVHCPWAQKHVNFRSGSL